MALLIKHLYSIQSLITVSLYQFTSPSLLMLLFFLVWPAPSAWQSFAFALALCIYSHSTDVDYFPAFIEPQQHHWYCFYSTEILLQSSLPFPPTTHPLHGVPNDILPAFKFPEKSYKDTSLSCINDRNNPVNKWVCRKM